jgi:hypothetical protein
MQDSHHSASRYMPDSRGCQKLTCQLAELRVAGFGDGPHGFGEEGFGAEVLFFHGGVEDHG